MNNEGIFDRITKKRYQYPNKYSSPKFIDYMITDLVESVAYEIPPHAKAISEVVREVYRFTRFEPTNPYVFHKSVPAARNIHANEAYLVIDGDVIRYNPKSDLFEYVRYDKNLSGQLRIISVAELWRVMKFYGEFGMVLPLMDAGHLIAQLKIELDHNGISDGIVSYGICEEKMYEYLGLSRASHQISFCIEFSKVEERKKTNETLTECKRSMNYDAEVSQYEIAKRLLTCNQKKYVEPLRWEEVKKPITQDAEFRESAHNFIGICSLVESMEQSSIDQCSDMVRNYLKRYVLKDDRFLIRMIFRTPKGDFVRTIDQDGYEDSMLYRLDKNRLLHDTNRMIDMESMPVSVYISYRYDKTLSLQDNVVLSHIKAAQISHYFLLCAPQYGFFGRPMRNLEDTYLEELFHSKDEIYMYSVILGKANSKNYVTYM